jgi:hypothetical protein
MLSRSSATDTLRTYRTHILASLMLAVYYVTMSYYFFHHGKVVPKEQTSDWMVQVFQYGLVFPFYMGFHQLAIFMFREDVQRAFSRYVATARYWLLVAWDMTVFGYRIAATVTGIVIHAIGVFLLAVYRVARRFILAALRLGQRLLIHAGLFTGAVLVVGLAVSMEALKDFRAWARMRIRGMKRFADTCVEVGQSARM